MKINKTSKLIRHCSSDATLTHVNETGKARMINVGSKKASKRTASAESIVRLPNHVYDLVKQNLLKKGDVLATARLAGIMGAKQTSNLVPLCHPISLRHVDVQTEMIADGCIRVTSIVEAYDVTGVEMEALVAASIASLTIYDMCKAASHDIKISNVRLMMKTGGKRDFHRDHEL